MLALAAVHVGTVKMSKQHLLDVFGSETVLEFNPGSAVWCVTRRVLGGRLLLRDTEFRVR